MTSTCGRIHVLQRRVSFSDTAFHAKTGTTPLSILPELDSLLFCCIFLKMQKKHMEEGASDARHRLEAILRRPIHSADDARRAREAAELLEALIEIEDRATRLDGTVA